LDELLPLFLEESRERLDRLSDLLSEAGSDPEAAAQARRELHALKGASRMMGLVEVSELCHEAESTLELQGEGALETSIALVDRIVRVVGLLGDQAGPRARRDGPAAAAGRGRRKRASGELRVRSEVMDGLADRGARLRVLSVMASGLVDRMHRLVRLAERGVGERESGQVLAALATSMRQLAGELEAGQQRMERLAEGLLDALLRQQVQPLRPVLLGLARHARELSASLSKQLEVIVEVGDGQLDRRIVHALQEALLHLVRNAVDHGLESPRHRSARGKPERGVLRLEANSEGDRVRFVIADDGRGIDTALVLETAIRRGQLTADAADRISPEDALQLLYMPGFSTREEANELSGRGIGLDAVAAAVRGVGGDLELVSEPGRGTTVLIEVPAARRGERVLVLRAGECHIGLPAAAVRGYHRLQPGRVDRDGEGHAASLDGETVIRTSLSTMLGGKTERDEIVIEVNLGGRIFALLAEGVLGEEEVFLTPLPEGTGAPAVFDCMALLGSGRPVPVLSLQRLGTLAIGRMEPIIEDQRSRALRVLLVDDSNLTREMVGRLLSDAGFSLRAVASGDDALRLLAEADYDCLVTDIEMPGIDGLELTRRLRAEPRFADLPIIVVSTHDRPADRRAGLDAGADAYLAKQRLEAQELVALVRRLGGAA
jgi:chemotaxis protein histidine kinase CheA/ActR/RegA family two-component response regulator